MLNGYGEIRDYPRKQKHEINYYDKIREIQRKQNIVKDKIRQFSKKICTVNTYKTTQQKSENFRKKKKNTNWLRQKSTISEKTGNDFNKIRRFPNKREIRTMMIN